MLRGRKRCTWRLPKALGFLYLRPTPYEMIVALRPPGLSSIARIYHGRWTGC